MSIFKNIDSKIEHLSKELNARITIDRSGFIGKFEERRIDWLDNHLRKAIIIQPKFEKPGINQKLWSFRIVAWKGPIAQYAFTQDLMSDTNFLDIENSIDDLFEKGLSVLTKIKESDLKKRFD